MHSVTVKKKLSPAETRDRIQAICDEHGYCPFTAMIQIAQGAQTMEVNGKIILVAETSPELRFQAAKELASYLAPKLKQLEHAGTIDHEYTFKLVHVNQDSRPPELRNVTPTVLESPANGAQEN